MTDPIQAVARLRAALEGESPDPFEVVLGDVREVLSLLTPGVLQLAIERRRQIDEEGYNPLDDHGRAPQLFDAACEYATAATTAVLLPHRGAELPVPFGWPWEAGFWKPASDPVKNARRSGALLAAGIDALLAEQVNPTKES